MAPRRRSAEEHRSAMRAELLVVPRLTACNSSSSLPAADDCGLLNFGAWRSGVFPRQYGVSLITTDGRATTQVALRPGAIVGDLTADQRLCVPLLASSTSDVDVTLHRYPRTRRWRRQRSRGACAMPAP